MARLRRFAHNVGSSYLALGVNIGYSLISVPMVLAFLPQKEFGLWALLMQIIGYLSLVDLGMTGAATRLLIDHKDDPQGKSYASMFKTSCLVAAAQGAIIFLLGAVLSPFFPGWLGTPPELATEFTCLLRWQAGLTALSFLTRPLGQLLGAHQRMDVTNYGGIIQLASGLGFLWYFLHRNCGVVSFIYANAAGFVLTTSFLWGMCVRLELVPRGFSSTQASMKSFREVFSFGKDLLLVTLGTQLIMASQLILITRCLGLEMAAAWTVGTRVFNLLCQFIWRLSDSASPALAEMMARGEKSKLFQRYKEIVVLSLSASGIAAVIFAFTNSLFVSIWTSGKIGWSQMNDGLLAVWLLLLVGVHAHCGFVLLTKEIRWMRFIYFVEGAAFAIGSFLTLQIGKIPSMITVSILCCSVFSGAYGIRRVAEYFGCSIREIAWDWCIPMLLCIGLALPVAILIRVGVFRSGNHSPLLQFALLIGLLGIWGGIVFCRVGIPNTLRAELQARSARWMQPVFTILFPRN